MKSALDFAGMAPALTGRRFIKEFRLPPDGGDDLDSRHERMALTAGHSI